jgi:hypothetical protein
VSERNGDKARFGRDRKRKALRRKKNQEFRRNLVTLPAIHVSTQRMSGLGWRVDPNAEISPQLLHTYRSDRA